MSKIFLPLAIVSAIFVSAATWRLLPREEIKNEFVEVEPHSAFRGLSSTVHAQPWVLPTEQKIQYLYQKKIQIEGFGQQIPDIHIRGVFSIEPKVKKGEMGEYFVSFDFQKPQNDSISAFVRYRQSNHSMELFIDSHSTKVDQENLNVLKDLLAQFFYLSNEDTVGTYRYQISKFENGSSNNQFLRKTKKEYLKGFRAPRIDEFVQQIELNQKSVPIKIQVKERSSIGDQPYSLASNSNSKFEFLKMVASRQSSDLSKNFQQKVSLQLIATQLALDQNPEYQKIHWPTVLQEIQKIAELSASEQLRVFGDLVKALRLDPSRVADLRKILFEKDVISKGAESQKYQSIVGALATDGSVQAQEILVEAYQHPQNPQSGKGSILGALTTTQAPLSDQTIEFLKQASEHDPDIDLRNGALFALGSAIEKVKEPESEIQFLKRKWSEALSSQDLQQQLVVMDAMGNSGRVELFPEVSEQAKGASQVALRSKAVFALRGMNLTGARELLAKSLMDLDPSVRFGAASAMYQAPWSIEFANPVSQCSKGESVDSIRNICTEVLQKVQSQVATNQ